jgi:subtilisin family serine protease
VQRVVIDPSTPQALEDLCKAKGAAILGECEGTDYCLVEVPKGTKLEDFLKDLEDEPCVEDAQPDEDVRFPEGDGTTVPAFVDEDLSGIRAQVAVDRIGGRAAQARGRLGVGAVVAVVDTGIDFTHRSSPAASCRPATTSSTATTTRPTSATAATTPRRPRGRGRRPRHVRREPDPGGRAGRRIMPIRALDGDAMGTAAASPRDRVGRGGRRHRHQLQRRAQPRPAPHPPGHPVRRGPQHPGHRRREPRGRVDFPAAHPSVVAVASLDLDDVRSPFSAFGPEVDLAAPGEDLLGAHPSSPSGVARWSGTSFASALVSGAFAVVMAGIEPVPYDEYVGLLQGTARAVDDVNRAFAGEGGAGCVDVYGATAAKH